MIERITKIYPAWDRRDPNPSKNYGIHGAELRMVLKGELGATQFVLYTNWHLPHVTEELLHRPYKDELDIKVRFLPLPADVGYHSPTPLYEGQAVCSDHCEYLDGKPCYYDGSGLFAEEVYKKLVEGGSDEVWKILEERYMELFGELR